MISSVAQREVGSHSSAGTDDAPPIRRATARPHPEGTIHLAQPTQPAKAEAGADAPGFLELRLWAEMYDDVQKTRIACTNRAERGGVDPETFAPQLAAMSVAEHQLQLALGRCYRRTVPAPIREWQQHNMGVGEHLLARLLGALGHPRIATPYHWETGDAPAGHECDPARCGTDRHLVADPPFERSLRQLWAYCGHGDPTRRRRAGMTADDAAALGQPRAKMLVHLLAVAAMKSGKRSNIAVSAVEAPAACSGDESTLCPQADRSAARHQLVEQPTSEPEAVVLAAALISASITTSEAESNSAQGISGTGSRGPSEASRGADPCHLRDVYDHARETYATRDGWTLGHQHNAALRLVGKELLRGLWLAADLRSAT